MLFGTVIKIEELKNKDFFEQYGEIKHGITDFDIIENEEHDTIGVKVDNDDMAFAQSFLDALV